MVTDSIRSTPHVTRLRPGAQILTATPATMVKRSLEAQWTPAVAQGKGWLKPYK